MPINSLYRAIELLSSVGLEMDPPNPVDELDVLACENAIGANLPLSYRKFLLTYGYGGFESVEFSGLLAGNLKEFHQVNAYAVTKYLQNTRGFPLDHFVIQNFDGDAVACLNLSSMKDGECQVVLWDHSESPERQSAKPYVLAGSFGEYFLQLAKEEIEDRN